jgi:hypothetical protein
MFARLPRSTRTVTYGRSAATGQLCAVQRSRRTFLSLLLLAPAPLALAATEARGPTRVEMWKEASCGCCGDWAKHLEANGFTISTHTNGNTATRARLGIPLEYGSCHTALVEGYAIEGHVPAADIRRLLRERPAAVGLAVPGMPIGSPGMDGPEYGGRKDPYDVLLVMRDGRARRYRSYP